jgi:hypothetical protein
MSKTLRVVILKPSKYAPDDYVERFRWGFMPNSTVPYMRSMTPDEIDGSPVRVHAIDEYVHTDLAYMSLLDRPAAGGRTLLALVGVQSHQFHRALDLAAHARANGCMAVIGGPHVMTCDTSMLHNRGVSFALAEAELIWPQILQDAAVGELRPVYGREQRWQETLDAPVIRPPDRQDLGRYVVPMLGLYPARGCPFRCNFCSVIKIAGRRIRSQSVATTIDSLRAARDAGVRMVMFTSDNFNKYPEAEELLGAMIEQRLRLPFFAQCDTQVAKQEQLVALMARAGCFQMFVGVESFNRRTLLAAKKAQNHPGTYHDIVRLCRDHGISSHFSNIIGFPEDTEPGVREHLQTLREMSPTWSSFYILTPIPGTEQYDEFRAKGWITEPNLDRYDGTHLTWRHPRLARSQLTRMLFDCYLKFHSWQHTLATVRRLRIPGRIKGAAEIAGTVGMALFNRYCGWRKMHPMSGGVRRVFLDRAADFLGHRQGLFGFGLAPLPASLPLTEGEARLNKMVNPRVRQAAPAETVPSVALPVLA